MTYTMYMVEGDFTELAAAGGMIKLCGVTVEEAEAIISIVAKRHDPEEGLPDIVLRPEIFDTEG